MGKRGTKPTAIAVHQERGTLRNYHTDKGMQPRTIEEIPTPPPTLGEHAKHIWYNFLSSAVQINGYLANSEIPLVEIMCINFQIWYEAEEYLKVNGRTIINDKGMEIVNPMVRVGQGAFDNYFKLMREFGMTPTTRNGVSLIDVKQDDDWGI